MNDLNSSDIVDVLEKLKDNYHYLTNSTRKVADFILKNPHQVVYMPITELAELVGVSEYTIMKLCKSIGLSGYNQLKINLSKKIVDPIKNIHEEVSEDDETVDIVDKVYHSYLVTLESTKERLDTVQFQMAIEAIEKANKIEFYGMGTSSVIAKDAYHKFFRLDANCRFLEDSHMQAMSASMLSKEDVVIAISNSGSNRELISALKQAKKAGATVICITSHPRSPIIKVSDIKIIVDSPENLYRGEPMGTRIAQIYIIDLLFVSVALKKKETFLSNLNKTRESLSDKKL